MLPAYLRYYRGCADTVRRNRSGCWLNAYHMWFLPGWFLVAKRGLTTFGFTFKFAGPAVYHSYLAQRLDEPSHHGSGCRGLTPRSAVGLTALTALLPRI